MSETVTISKTEITELAECIAEALFKEPDEWTDAAFERSKITIQNAITEYLSTKANP